MTSAWPPFTRKWWQYIFDKAYCTACGTSQRYTHTNGNQYTAKGFYCQHCGAKVHIFVEVVDV